MLSKLWDFKKEELIRMYKNAYPCWRKLTPNKPTKSELIYWLCLKYRNDTKNKKCN